MPHLLTEKTLELNIIAELAYISRKAGYRPYFIGFSQLEEISNGLDSHFRAGAKIGFFQFKRGYPRSDFFTFYINNNAPHFNQHITFSKTNLATNACCYVFPLIASNKDVYFCRGALLEWTAFLSPKCFDPLNPSNTRHRVRMYFSGKWRLYSESNDGNWSNIYGRLPEYREYKDTRFPPREAGNIFHELHLPSMAETLSQLDRTDVQTIFEQRSSFCMIFDE